MVSPIDYTLDVVNPFQAAMQGFQSGQQIISNAEVVKAQKAAEARKQLEAMQQQKMQSDLYDFSLMPNKTAEDYTTIINRYPSLAEPYQKSWGMLNAERQQQTLSTASQVYESLRNGAPDIAKSILDEQIKGYENSGMKKEAFNLKSISSMIDKNPQVAQANLGMLMASVDPEQFKNITDARNANEMQPYEIAQKQAQTNKTIAETNDIPLAAEDRKQGVINQGTKIEYDNQYNYDKLTQDQQQFLAGLSNDQQKEAARLRAQKNENTTQRMERLEKANGFASVAVNASDTAKLAAELINDYKRLSDASGAGVWNAAMRNIPGTAEYNFARRVETLKSQGFLIGAQSLKGLGAMTEIEGKKATDALGNLDLNQSTGQVAQQLASIAKAANNVAQVANKNAQNYATKGMGYSKAVTEAAKTLGISNAEAQKFVNENGL
ncbi:hypothetical protein [Acinetobacter bereziniae]|uniref:hypothetical protein n=1 Tax=Acinetobacter bereziniae TaxID=106648 RepID=UPI0030093384